MEDINLRILRVTDGLRTIQRELNSLAMQAPNDPQLMEALGDSPDLDSIRLLKCAVDQMRHFLWFYFQVTQDKSEAGEQLRQTLRQAGAAAPSTDQRADVERLRWPSDVTLIRLLADGSTTKPN
jgi:hypothetical protein